MGIFNRKKNKNIDPSDIKPVEVNIPTISQVKKGNGGSIRRDLGSPHGTTLVTGIKRHGDE